MGKMFEMVTGVFFFLVLLEFYIAMADEMKHNLHNQ